MIDYSNTIDPILVRGRQKGLKGYVNITRSGKYGNPHPVDTVCEVCSGENEITHNRDMSIFHYGMFLIVKRVDTLKEYLKGLLDTPAFGVACKGHYKLPKNISGINVKDYTPEELLEILVLESGDYLLTESCHGETIQEVIKILRYIDQNKIKKEYINYVMFNECTRRTHRPELIKKGFIAVDDTLVHGCIECINHLKKYEIEALYSIISQNKESGIE